MYSQRERESELGEGGGQGIIINSPCIFWKNPEAGSGLGAG